MNRTVTGLLMALLIQCGLIAIIFWPAQNTLNEATQQTLAPFSSAAIDQICIGDEFDNETVLVKSGERWLLADLENLPADTAKVETLLKGITGQAGTWPIARTPAARQRFQVADYYYQRRLILMSGADELGTLYLGTSPGFRKVHARNERQDAIFSITLNTFDVPAVSGAWLDPGLLQIRAPLRIDADLYSLNFDGGVWLTGIGRVPEAQELQALITALRTIQVDGVANEDLQRELSTVEADIILAVESLAGEVTLELLTLHDEHFVYSSQYPLFFTLSADDFDRLAGIDVGLISGEATDP